MSNVIPLGPLSATETPTSTPIPPTPEYADELTYDPAAQTLNDPQGTPVFALDESGVWIEPAAARARDALTSLDGLDYADGQWLADGQVMATAEVVMTDFGAALISQEVVGTKEIWVYDEASNTYPEILVDDTVKIVHAVVMGDQVYKLDLDIMAGQELAGGVWEGKSLTETMSLFRQMTELFPMDETAITYFSNNSDVSFWDTVVSMGTHHDNLELRGAFKYNGRTVVRVAMTLYDTIYEVNVMLDEIEYQPAVEQLAALAGGR